MFLTQTDRTFADIAYTSNIGRQHFPYRIALVAKSLNEALEKLKKGEYRQGIASDQHKGKISDFSNLENLAETYCLGATIDWEDLHRSYQGHKVSIPSYPFQRERYWAPALEMDRPKESAVTSQEFQEFSKLPVHECRAWLIQYTKKILKDITGVTVGDIEKGFFILV